MDRMGQGVRWREPFWLEKNTKYRCASHIEKYEMQIVVPGGRIGLPTHGFSIHCSTTELPRLGSELNFTERILAGIELNGKYFSLWRTPRSIFGYLSRP